MKRLLSLLLLAAVSWGTSAQTVPGLINYQGKLTDASAQALPDGVYSVAFRIWNRQVAGDPGDELVWGSEYQITLVRGAFNTILGADGGISDSGALTTNLAKAFDGPDRYLGISIRKTPSGAVPGSKEIVPRQQLLSAPYAVEAQRSAIATSLIKDLADALCPPGTVVAYLGSTAPSGWLVCNGSLVSRTTYSRLYAAIGDVHGIGDGTSTFGLPDMRGRVLMGAGQGVGLSNRAVLGQMLGAEAHTLTVDQIPSHKHWSIGSDASGWLYGSQGGPYIGFRDMDGNNALYGTSNAGGNQPHNIVQPSVVVNYIIKY